MNIVVDVGEDDEINDETSKEIFDYELFFKVRNLLLDYNLLNNNLENLNINIDFLSYFITNNY
jgi:hypothetical protein